ncbi:MAG: MIP/aquaporin family protein [Endomicrobiales bacterium]
MDKLLLKNFAGELLGTFVLVFFGCGAITVSTLFTPEFSLFALAASWGAAVILGIYASRHLSAPHLNPAVSIAMAALGRLPLRRMLVFVLGQLIGAFLAAALLYFLFSALISAFEAAHHIVRGSPGSVTTASLFGAYFQKPSSQYLVTPWNAALAEGVGTFMLVLMVTLVTERHMGFLAFYSLAPIFFGITVSGIVVIIAPVSSSAINPARDFGPKLFMALAGWGAAALPGPQGGFFTVYILSPIVGGLLAVLLYARLLRPLLRVPEPKEKESAP